MKTIFNLIFIICSSFSLHAQSWVASSGPEGGAAGPIIYHQGDLITFTTSEMYRSTNLGDSWSISTPIGVDQTKIRNSIISVGDYLYCYTENKLYASSNKGQTWMIRDSGITYPSLWGAELSYSGTNLYVAFSQGDAFKSSNQGGSFVKLGRAGLPNGKSLRLVVEAGGNLVGTAYADGLYYSINGGATWTKSFGGPTTTVSSVVYVDGLLYATVDHPNPSLGGLFVSTNNGQSFTKKNSIDGLLKLIKLNNRVFVFSRTGQTFEIQNSGNSMVLYNNVIAMPFFMTSNGSNLWFAITNRGFHRSADGGSNWGLANKGLGFTSARSFVNIGDTYFLVGNGGVWKSSTQAIRWVPTTTIAAIITDLTVDGNQLYAATETLGVFVSSNNGDSWQSVGTGFPTTGVTGAFIEKAGGHLFVFVRQGSSGGLYKLTSTTGSWQKILNSTSMGNISVVGNRIYVQSKYSDDYGASWSNVSGIPGSGEIYEYVTNGNYTYALAFPFNQKPLYRSSDGRSFTAFTSGLHDTNYSDVPSAVAKGDSVFIISDNGAKGGSRELFAYFTTSSASGWTKLLDGLPEKGNASRHSLYATDYSILLGTVNNTASVFRWDFATVPPQNPDDDIVIYPPLGPSISLTANPQTINLPSTGSASTTLTVAANGGFNGTVSLSIVGTSPISTTFNNNVVTTQGTRTLTFTSNGVAEGTYPVKVLAKSGSIESEVTISVNITSAANPEFNLITSTKSLSIPQGAFGTTDISFTPLGGFSGAVALSVDASTPLPAGVTATFTPPSISSGSSTLRFDVDATAAPVGPVSITVRGVSGSISQTVKIDLTITEVTEPTFVLNASPQSLTIAQGGGGEIDVTITALAGFDQEVDLTYNLTKAGVSASFNPAFIMGEGESLLSIIAEEDADLGAAELTITATSGTIVRTVSISLQVEPPPVEIYPANQFSPNGDGIDDTWQITDIEKAPQLVISVFNRVGQVVFRTKAYQNDWDGTSNGRQLLPATYFYVIRNEKGENVETGSVNLIR